MTGDEAAAVLDAEVALDRGDGYVADDEAIGGMLAALAPLFIDALAGIVAGALILGGMTAARRLFR